MYIGIDGSVLTKRIDQIKDSLIFNFSIDKLDIPFNELYGIRKNIRNNSTEVISKELRAEISQMITDRPFFKGVELEDISIIKEKAYVIVSVGKETLSIPIE